jgi:hypothetical protein
MLNRWNFFSAWMIEEACLLSPSFAHLLTPSPKPFAEEITAFAGKSVNSYQIVYALEIL